MEAHKRILAILFIISGSLQILGMLLLSALFRILTPYMMEHAKLDEQWILEWIIPFIGVIAFIVISLFAIPSIIGGIALLNKKQWALTVLLILGCFKLFSFPVGTALGIYTIWVYAENHKHINPSSS